MHFRAETLGAASKNHRREIFKSISTQRNMGPLGRIIWGKLFPIPFIVGGAVIAYTGLDQVWSSFSSPSWPTVEGEILRSEVNVSRDSDSTSYRPEITFQYIIPGEDSRRIADTHTFGQWGSGSYAKHLAVVDSYPAGSTVTVYYNPSDPSIAVLEPGLSMGAIGTLMFGLVTLSVGMGVMFFLPRALANQES